MNSQSIRIFLTLAEHKNLSDAAKVLFFSQSAISQSISKLEKDLGVQLVFRERGSRQIRLTPAGEAFLPLARMRQEVDVLFQQFIQAQKKKSLRIAANATAHQYLVPEIVQSLMQRSTDLDLQLTSATNVTIPRHTENSLCDVAFFTGDAPRAHSVIAFPFFQAEVCVLCSSDTALPDRPISPAELDPHFEVTHRIFSQKKQHLEWRQQHFPANIPPWVQTSTFMSLDNYLTDSRCWAIVPIAQALFFVSRKPTQLAIRRITPIPYYQPCSILISKTYMHKDLIDEFLQCCHEYLASKPYLINCLPQ